MKKAWMTMVAMLAVMLMITGLDVRATELTAARDTAQRDGSRVSIGMASNTTIYAGAMVAINTSGYAVPASDTAGYLVVGRAEETVDNSGTAGDGALNIEVRRGVFRWANGDTFTIADVGALAYVKDDATVQKAASATHNVVAGLIIDVDSEGVWVDTYAIGGQGAASLTTLDTTGAASIGTTLAVTGVATFTAESVHDGGLDADYLTTDAAAGVDTKTAGTLMLGEATATKVEIADTGVETEIQGTLDAQEAATFASTVGITGDMTGAADVKGATLSIGDGSLSRIGDTLVWVEGGVTNSLVADVTNP